MDAVLARGESMINVFIDYTAAFDSWEDLAVSLHTSATGIPYK
jgi:hypothetical protein